MDNNIEHSRKARAIGMMCIITGGLALIGIFALALFIWAMSHGLSVGFGNGTMPWYWIPVLTLIISLPAIVTIVGGIYALKRRKWGLVLSGVICSLLYFNIIGIPALVLTLLSKDEFK